MIGVTYKSSNYTPEAVTGKYVACKGRKGNYQFQVFETTGVNGQGATLREYLTLGEEIPQEIKDKCIKSKTTEKWV